MVWVQAYYSVIIPVNLTGYYDKEFYGALLKLNQPLYRMRNWCFRTHNAEI